MRQSDALTQGEVLELVYAWFQNITNKVNLDKILPLLSRNELEMRFPEKTLYNDTDFAQWYEEVTHLFFDQVHDVTLLAVDLNGRQANVTLIVNWKSRTWKAPAPTSTWQETNVHQTWLVKRNPDNGTPVIAGYYVGLMS